jgi:hypothetical protein
MAGNLRKPTSFQNTQAVVNSQQRQPAAPNSGTTHLNANNQFAGVVTASVGNPLARKPR